MKFEKDKFYIMEHAKEYTVISKVLGIRIVGGTHKIDFQDIYATESKFMERAIRRWSDTEEQVKTYFIKIKEIDIDDYPEYLL